MKSDRSRYAGAFPGQYRWCRREKVHTFDQVQHGGIEDVRFMLGIGDQRYGTSTPLHPISDCAAGMIETSGHNLNARVWSQNVAGFKILTNHFAGQRSISMGNQGRIKSATISRVFIFPYICPDQSSTVERASKSGAK